MKFKPAIALSITICLLFLFIQPSVLVSADDPNPDPNGAWGEVINPDGTINYADLTDGGVVSQPGDFMPSIPLVGPIDATYHVYYTPSGNTVVMPTATTMLFMAMNPQDSSPLTNSAASLGNPSVLLAGMLTGANIGNPTAQAALAGITGLGYDDPQNFFSDVIAGNTNIWSLGPEMLPLLSSLASQSVSDRSLYTMMLLFPPGTCTSAPGGCTANQLALLTTPVPTAVVTPPPGSVSCPAPSVRVGAITAGGQKTSPNYPLVVGQDPAKTGVDLSFHASVAATIYTFYTQEPIVECKGGPNGKGEYNCGGGTGHKAVTGYRCVKHTQSYKECIASASGSIMLSDSSRKWILNVLSIHFPRAYIHRPYFNFGGSGCSWSATGKRVQIDDPGTWNISVAGHTSGTPVSAPRGFSRGGSPFQVALKEVEIVK